MKRRKLNRKARMGLFLRNMRGEENAFTEGDVVEEHVLTCLSLTLIS